jgi:hypothetical protein
MEASVIALEACGMGSEPRGFVIPVVLKGGGDECRGMGSSFHGIYPCAPSNLHSPGVTSTSVLGGHVASRAVTKSSASDTL